MCLYSPVLKPHGENTVRIQAKLKRINVRKKNENVGHKCNIKEKNTLLA